MLKIPEEKFWRTSPRKLMALVSVHINLHSDKDNEESKKSNSKDTIKKVSGW